MISSAHELQSSSAQSGAPQRGVSWQPSKLDEMLQDERLSSSSLVTDLESPPDISPEEGVRKAPKSKKKKKKASEHGAKAKKKKKRKKQRDSDRDPSLRSAPDYSESQTDQDLTEYSDDIYGSDRFLNVTPSRPSSLDNIDKPSKGKLDTSAHGDASIPEHSERTMETEMSTPISTPKSSVSRMSVDLSRHMPGLEANIDFPIIYEEPAKKRRSKKPDSKKSIKSKKDKKKKKAKKKETKKKATLNKRVNQRSFGSFESQRSLGSYEGERPSSMNFTQKSTESELEGEGRLGISDRAENVVSMPEPDESPHGRKVFNDNNRELSASSFNSLTLLNNSFRRSNKSLEASSSAVSESSASKVQMIPKSQQVLIPSSGPGFTSALRNRKNNADKSDPNDPPKEETEIPMTKYSSAPQATHPNEAVSKTWKSPLEGAPEMEYEEPGMEKTMELKGSFSEDSEIEDPWDGFGPSAYLEKSDSSSQSEEDNEPSTSSYSEVSAITTSLHTGHTRTGPSPRRMRAISRGITIVEKMMDEEDPLDRVAAARMRPRSPTPPREDKKSFSLLRTLSAETSGEEGSVSLHGDASVRTNSLSPVDKKERRTANRQNREDSTPTVPRFHKPARIRFGEGQSDPYSPRPRDRSPSLPRRMASQCDRRLRSGKEAMEATELKTMPNLDESSDDESGHEAELEDRTSKGIQQSSSDDSVVLEEADDEDSYRSENNDSDYEEEQEQEEDDGEDNDSDYEEQEQEEDDGDDSDNDSAETPTSQTHIDDADAAAGRSSRTPSPDKDSFPTGVSEIVQNYEEMDLETIPIRSYSPSPYKRKPKNLKPMPLEARHIPATMMVYRSPSLPVEESSIEEQPSSPQSPSRHASDPVLPTTTSKFDGELPLSGGSVTKETTRGRTKSPKSRTTAMAIKPQSPAAPRFSDLSSTAKEALTGTSADWDAAPLMVVRDTNYEEFSDSSQSEEPVREKRKSPRGRSKSKRTRSRSKSKSNRSRSAGDKEEKIARGRSKSKRSRSIEGIEKHSAQIRSVGDNDKKSIRLRSPSNSKRSRSVSQKKKKSIRKKSASDKGRKSPKKKKPKSFEKISATDPSDSPRRRKPKSLEKISASDLSDSPRKRKPRSYQKKHQKNHPPKRHPPSSPRKNKPRSYDKKRSEHPFDSTTKTLPPNSPTTVDGTTDDAVFTSPRAAPRQQVKPADTTAKSTPLQRVKEFGKNLWCCTPGSLAKRDRNAKNSFYASRRSPDLPPPRSSNHYRPIPHSPTRRRPSNSPGPSRNSSSSPGRHKTPSQITITIHRKKPPPPPMNGFFSRKPQLQRERERKRPPAKTIYI